jgi:hypothetical protein
MFCNLTGLDQIGPTQNDDRIVPNEKESEFTDGGNYKQAPCIYQTPRGLERILDESWLKLV